ncbi:LysM domain-containing protein [Trichophyton mentagrophytes]|nr:LysM domain-containing protein [Trichophyton mentagrophytes]
MIPRNLISGLSLLPFAAAELNIYGYLDLKTLADGFHTTTACIAALNQTVDCDAKTAVAAAVADTYYWTLDNVTTLCTSQCQQSLTSWTSAVDAACGNNPIVEDGIIKLASSTPLTYKEGFDLVCLKSGDSWCMIESQEWQGSDILKYPIDYCSTGDPEYDGPECFEEGFDQLAIQADDERMTSLYEKDLLCSDCFLKVFRQRLLSPFLLKGGYTSYLVEQFQDMQSYCSTSMPYATSTSEVFMGTATRTMPTGSPPPATTCGGPTIQPTDPPLSCEAITDKYNVTTGDVRHRTGNVYCEFSEPLCLPEPCQIGVVPLGSTCTSLLEKYSSPEFNITLSQFLNWNPYLAGSCDLLPWHQRVCIRPPGGSYESQPPVHQPTGASEYYTTAIPPAPTSTGTTPSCGRYYEVVAGDQCNTIALHFGITVDAFLSLNTQIDERCSNLWIAYAYCFKYPPNPPTVYVVQITVTQPVKKRVLGTAVRSVDIVDQPMTIVDQDIVTQGNVLPATELPSPKMGRAALSIMIGSVVTRLLENAVLSMDTAGARQTSAQQGIVIQAPVIQTSVKQVLTVRADQALQETRPAPALNLAHAVTWRDIVGMEPTTAHPGDAIPERAKGPKIHSIALWITVLYLDLWI